ncbi:hypothetical protein [Pseudodesulfovibrio sediminis]|uniref:DUF4412 domain-containing protein n=1 Tax=Pseudodesulfovibrio sediminis TaxID=2810563 RepID=A0ABM7P832_9BACT|nr:hypothetical protein [Pseudodesulfovibrio sediminis]BCS89140.1 hypothetical protein PSDVSF_23820 [Pseudodesulfovibrio sediminis]
MRQLLFFLCCVLFMPTAALAASDVVATYTYSDGSMVTLVTRDAEHVRMDTSETTYMLLSGGKAYSVSCENGQCSAMDMGAMMGMVSGSSMFGGGEDDYDVRYQDTGRTETVAGYKGSVYTAIVFENGKEISRDEIVLGSHSNVRKLTEGWIAFAEALTQTLGQSFKDSLDEAKKMGYGGILRYGDDMRLTKLSVKNLHSSYYKLPATTQQSNSQPAMQQQSTEQGDSMVEQDAKELGQEARQDTKNELKDAIGSAIGSLFD